MSVAPRQAQHRPVGTVDPPDLRQQRAVLVLAAAGTLLVLVAFTAPLTTLTITAQSLRSSPAEQTWLLSAMSLGLAAALLITGALGDDLGRRRVFVIGAAVLCTSTVVCAASTTSVEFILARIVQGAGGAAVVACSLGLVGHAFPAGPARAHAAGIWGASVGAGIALGPLLSAALANANSWRDVYWVVAAATLAVTVLARRRLAESRSATPRRLDLAGMVLLAGALALLLVALVAGRDGWSRPVTVSELIGAAVLVGAFLIVEHRSPEPMLELRLFARPAFFAVTVAALTTGLTIIALMCYFPTLLQRGLGRGALTAALLLMLWSVTSVVTALGARHLPSRFTGRRQMVASLLVIATGEALLADLHPHSSLGALVPGLLVAGAGSGVLNAALGREAVASVPPERAGMGSGANNTARYLGSAIGVTVVVAIISARHDAATPAGLAGGWNVAAIVTAAIAVLGALVIALRR